MLILRVFPIRLVAMAVAVLVVLLLALGFSTAFDVVHSRLGGDAVADAVVVDSPARLSTQRTIEMLQARLSQRRDDPAGYRDLGLAYLQRARETADPTYYTLADRALTTALDRTPNDPAILVGLGTLALARHQFADALVWGEKAKALTPWKPAVYGVIGDAQVELGRYDEAFDTVQDMVDVRPDSTSYARVSYFRELQGDRPGAIEAMRLAADASVASSEQGVWTRVQLGHLLLQVGAIDDAERAYRQALYSAPNYPLGLGGLGQARLTVGDYRGAIPYYEQAAERLPLPEFVLTLGDLYEAVGRPTDAARQFALARAIEQLIAANGGNVDLDLALFEADRGDPARALALARAEAARRSSIQVYDVLAWALYQTGDYPAAHEASRQALHLGTNNSLMLFHAAMIDLRLGNRTEARENLARALARNPGFSARYVPVARRLLAELAADR